MSQVSTIGLDIAKHVFHVHGADERGVAVFSRRLSRAKVLEFFARQPRCVVALEACGGAHYWARQLIALGHEVRLIAPAYVKPFVKRNKNDALDAEAICEAVQRPNMRFVTVKSEEQQRGRAPCQPARSTKRIVARRHAGEEAAYAGGRGASQQDGADRVGRADQAGGLQSSGRGRGVSCGGPEVAGRREEGKGGYGTTVGETGLEEPGLSNVPPKHA